jgi:hypothetical protein
VPLLLLLLLVLSFPSHKPGSLVSGWPFNFHSLGAD